jgi:hypothetical protein
LLKRGTDLRESARLGGIWEEIKIEIPTWDEVMGMPPHRRPTRIITNHMGPIEEAEINRKRSPYWFACVPDNPVPFVNRCEACDDDYRRLCEDFCRIEI